MTKLSVFNFTSLNGYYKAPGNDISWHRHGQEESEFSAEAMQSNNILLFGRITYEMMVSFWPTPMAIESAPKVAEGINAAEKVVFSKTLKKADWNNTSVISGDIIEVVKHLKETSANDLTILGSGSIVTQLAEAGLIDEFQIMIDPVALGAGTPLLQGINRTLDLKLTSSRTFNSGTVLLTYTAL